MNIYLKKEKKKQKTKIEEKSHHSKLHGRCSNRFDNYSAIFANINVCAYGKTANGKRQSRFNKKKLKISRT